ncbi:TetR/AcrR family transcriptional regulator [Agromyces silvae]|uniref:TetR/AcrR family transcriptional regulator n=1 Tax=Agromyces silvae TaxID=3388266 RepID=UPI00280A7FED|nr:TetR family transcriptional regulator C-terminal domain-containing protein [Agromyces protaetiae]
MSIASAPRTPPDGSKPNPLVPSPDAREGQPERRRERLIAAAASEIAAKGFAAVRLRDVAARCEVTTGMVQYYFETRDDLLAAALEYAATRHIRQWNDALSTVDHGERRIRALLTEMAEEFSHSEDNVVWIELCALASRDDRFRTLVSRVFDEWQSAIEQAITTAANAGAVTVSVPIADAARILVAAIDGFELRLASTASTKTAPQDQRHIAQLVDLLLIEP